MTLLAWRSAFSESRRSACGSGKRGLQDEEKHRAIAEFQFFKGICVASRD